MRKIFFLLLMWNSTVFAQTGYLFPIDIPIILSSNFGELRASHFHSGLDIKTKARVGWPVKAIEQGYVSRIRISSGGYGRAIYINHPDGHTSVYAHLKEFSPKLEQLVLRKQKELKMSELELYFAPDYIPVAKGEIIALSGNSGHSGGPHLHFEIRNTKTEFPLNPLSFYPQIVDYEAPIAKALYIYNLSSPNFDAMAKARYIKLNYVKRKTVLLKKTIYVPEYSAIGIRAVDKMTNSPNHFGVYRLQLFLDSTLYFTAKFDSFSFMETRGINALMDYKIFKTTNIKIYKLFQAPNNKLSVYQPNSSNGIIHLLDFKKHLVRIVLSDYAHNQRNYIFHLQRSQKITVSLKKQLNYRLSYHFTDNKINVQIPMLSVYYDYPFSLKRLNLKYSPWSFVYQIGYSYIPLKKAIVISFDTQDIPSIFLSKLYAVLINKNKRESPKIGSISNSYFVFQSFEFGTYYIKIDTIAPKALYVNKVVGIDYTGYRFKIFERGSGLADYNASVSGKWARVYYDAKYKLLTVYVDKKIVTTFPIEINLRDKCENSRIQDFSFK